ncbi:hypothetical protein [Amphritea pacifica]|uniref:hypothetical protein n=1 Tax=Amphritea pacifica TaxID=2811233 RepID=UPI0019638495|nr:hypothetical protein [Amphritea pacifica]MBN1006288.1 hypothetical protein [Amphritea pacifica]
MLSLDSLVTYHQEFRTALFVSGFTIGSFLFSMKTFILKTMRDDYYDNPEYQRKIAQRRRLGQEVKYYGPLKNFSRLFMSAIVLSFLSALSQISIGYVDDYRYVGFCLMLAFASWVLVAIAIYYVGINWSKALDLAENKAVEEEQKTVDEKNKSGG